MKWTYNPFTEELDALSGELTNLDCGKSDANYSAVGLSPIDGGDST